MSNYSKQSEMIFGIRVKEIDRGVKLQNLLWLMQTKPEQSAKIPNREWIKYNSWRKWLEKLK